MYRFNDSTNPFFLEKGLPIAYLFQPMARWKTFVTGLVSLSISSLIAAAADDFTRAKELEESGEFAKATTILKDALHSGKVPDDLRRKYEWQIDWMERVRQDYSESTDALFNSLTNAVKNLTREEFDGWVKEGRFDGRKIDG